MQFGQKNSNKQLILVKNYDFFKILLSSTGRKKFLKDVQKHLKLADFFLKCQNLENFVFANEMCFSGNEKSIG